MRLDLLKVVGSRPERRASRKATARRVPQAGPARPRYGRESGFAAFLPALPCPGPVPDGNYIRNRNSAQGSPRQRLKCARAADTVSAGSEKFFGKSQETHDKQGMRIRAHDLQNLSRFGLARRPSGRASTAAAPMMRRDGLYSFSRRAGRGDGAKTFLRQTGLF